MKILFIADSTSIHTQRWIKYFQEKGNEIFIITIGKVTHELPGVTHLANFESFSYSNLRCINILLQTKKIIKNLNPHILHSHFVHQCGWLGALTNFHPFVLTGWGTDIFKLPYSSKKPFGKLLTKYTLRKADAMTAISNHLKKEMVILGASNEKVQIVNWGVDLHRFKSDIDSSDLISELNLKSKLVLFCNRLHLPLYNIDVIIKSMPLILKKFPNTVLILQNAGGEPDKGLIKLADEIGVADFIRFVPRYNYKKLPQLYALADIFISVPSWDAGPVSLLEAMACGAVPVVSAIPGPMEWVTDKINGRVVPIQDIEKIQFGFSGKKRRPP